MQDLAGHVELVGLDLALADRLPLGLHERVGHRPADQQPVDFLDQAFDDADLVGDLGAAHHGDIGVLRIAEQGLEDPQLFFDQEADRAAVG